METRDHIIRECPRYNGHRDGLRKVSRDLYLPDILGTKEGIEALASTGTPKRPPIPPTLDEEEITLEDWQGDQDLERGEDPGNNEGTRSMHPCPIA
ncbi:uncharacterized protein EV420DRAFT_1517295 [Desarmillaria tabescens]|uniref:Uncharacterized protein n=1 Tax=Armillaria tabescens TaxID=1929756 RepID=A0AA39NFE6_ARMTA|nr:uncharacterized protein EV420DRAFT_1517295 [Desarmillaria tabescens]KAK0464628.1 hypothetical protein EV420DRAFT_1517295 [Desarmillaria tabescens]